MQPVDEYISKAEAAIVRAEVAGLTLSELREVLGIGRTLAEQCTARLVGSGRLVEVLRYTSGMRGRVPRAFVAKEFAG